MDAGHRDRSIFQAGADQFAEVDLSALQLRAPVGQLLLGGANS
jgi:hypothetical protein